MAVSLLGRGIVRVFRFETLFQVLSVTCYPYGKKCMWNLDFRLERIAVTVNLLLCTDPLKPQKNISKTAATSGVTFPVYFNSNKVHVSLKIEILGFFL